MLEMLSILVGLGLFGVMLMGAVLWFTKNHKADAFSPSCPSCGAKLPAVRRPSNLRQAMWGGWTCSQCHAEVDRRGQLIKAATNDVQRGALSQTTHASGDGALSMAQEGQLSDAEVAFDFDADAQQQNVHQQDAHAETQKHHQ